MINTKSSPYPRAIPPNHNVDEQQQPRLDGKYCRYIHIFARFQGISSGTFSVILRFITFWSAKSTLQVCIRLAHTRTYSIKSVPRHVRTTVAAAPPPPSTLSLSRSAGCSINSLWQLVEINHLAAKMASKSFVSATLSAFFLGISDKICSWPGKCNLIRGFYLVFFSFRAFYFC